MTNSTAYPLHQSTLPNGLRVVVSPDHAAPVVAVNLWYDVGSRHETPGRTGFAHLFEHLMFQGSTQVATGEHIGQLQAVGGSVNATTWFDRTNYFETVPTPALDLALWLEADRLGGLLDAVGQAGLDTQREVVKEEKRQRYDNVPYGDVMEHLVTLTFPADHPYGHTTIGSMADLDAASLTDVQAFFATHYRPANAVLTLVGDVEPEDAFARVERYFGPLSDAPAPPRPSTTPLPPLTGSPRREVRGDVPAEAVYLVWRLPARDEPAFDAADLALGVLGEGQSARLHRELVRRQGVADAAGATSMALVGGNSFAFAFAQARDGVPVERVEAALRDQFAALLDDGGAAELPRARAQYERSWLESLARVDARADEISAETLLRGDPEGVNRRLADLAALTADDVRDAVRTWLSPDAAATLVYRPRAEEAR